MFWMNPSCQINIYSFLLHKHKLLSPSYLKARCVVYYLLTELLTKQWTKQAAAGGNNRTSRMNRYSPPLLIEWHCPITTNLGGQHFWKYTCLRVVFVLLSSVIKCQKGQQFVLCAEKINHRQPAFVTDNPFWSQTICVSQREFLSVTEGLCSLMQMM